MRLYTNNQGSWVGTQADAKREFGKDKALVDVPVSKEALLKWLNACRVTSGAHQEAAAIATRVEPVAKPHSLSCSANPQSCSGNREVRQDAALNRYDVRDVVLNCPKEYLGGALSAIVTRIYDMEDEL